MEILCNIAELELSSIYSVLHHLWPFNCKKKVTQTFRFAAMGRVAVFHVLLFCAEILIDNTVNFLKQIMCGKDSKFVRFGLWESGSRYTHACDGSLQQAGFLNNCSIDISDIFRLICCCNAFKIKPRKRRRTF